MVGGGASGKPPVLVLTGVVFNPDSTVVRRFFVTEDTGFRCIGYAVTERLADATLRVLAMGTLSARTSEIRDLMDERAMYRRGRRYRRRKNILDQGKTAKYRPPRFESRAKRPSVTLNHGEQTHLNLFGKLARMAPLPPEQTVWGFESVAFDLRVLIYGKPKRDSDYRVSPLTRRSGEPTRAFIIRRDGGCIVCAGGDGLHAHHLRKRSRRGSNRPANQVTLCERCHADVHAGLVALPIEGGASWRDAGNVNAIVGMLRDGAGDNGLTPIPVEEIVAARHRLGLSKTHALDAVAGAVVLSGAACVDESQAHRFDLEQFRRHRRAHTHAQRDRLYYLDGQLVARNRRKRCDQQEPSFAELRAQNPSLIGQLTVKPAVRLYTPNRKQAPAVSGEVWACQGRRFVVHGTKDKGRYLHSRQYKEFTGKSYVSPAKCRRILCNEGMVVTAFAKPTPNTNQPTQEAAIPPHPSRSSRLNGVSSRLSG